MPNMLEKFREKERALLCEEGNIERIDTNE